MDLAESGPFLLTLLTPLRVRTRFRSVTLEAGESVVSLVHPALRMMSTRCDSTQLRDGEEEQMGTKDDLDIEDDNDVDVETDDKPDDKPDDAPPEPFVKEDGSAFTAKDYEALQGALRKARKEARDARRGGKPATDDKPDDKPDDAKAAEAARLKAEAETIARWKPLVVNNAARSALTSAGLIGSPDRLLRLLDLDEIDVDSETGEIDGLSEQVTDLKKDYPHLFRKRGGGSINAADRRTNGRVKDDRTPSQIQADMLLGKGGDDD